MEGRKPPDGGMGFAKATTEHRVREEARYKFKFFFTGLVFAILSFSMQFPISIQGFELKLIEAISWIFLGLTGILSIIDLGGFSLKDSGSELTGWKKASMWFFFVAGCTLLMVVKIATSFLVQCA